MKFLNLALLLTLTSCASYVDNFHRQISQEERSKSGAPRQRINQNYGDRRPVQNPVTLNGPTAGNVRNLDPRVQRQYTSNDRRARAEDFVDNQSDGSLWSGKESGNFLFVTNNLKRKGDIVIVEVMDALKDKIQDELKRSFPARRPTPKKDGAKDSAAGEAKKEENVADQKAADPNEVHDKISTSVIELVNQDYLMLRGRKEVMYQKVKRYFEFQAVVAQKDISSADAVRSNKILEPRINVLRY